MVFSFSLLSLKCMSDKAGRLNNEFFAEIAYYVHDLSLVV